MRPLGAGLRAGPVDDELAATAAGGPDAFADPADALLLALVDELHDSATVSDDVWGRLAERYDPPTLLELVILAGWYRLLSGVINAVGVELEPGRRAFPCSLVRHMSNYTQINLVDDVEDVAAERPGLEAHMGRKQLDSRDLGVSLFRYDAETRSAMTHSHRVQEEAYLVIEGSGRMLLGDEVVDLRQWDVVRVAPEVERAFEAGADGMAVVAVGGPRPEGGDGVRGGAEWPDDAGQPPATPGRS